MITSGFNYLHYDRDGSIDIDKTSESLLEYFDKLSQSEEDSSAVDNNTPAHVYVVCTTPSSAHWYEKPIAGVQGSYYSHTGLSLDKRMRVLYHVRSNGLIVSKRSEFKKEKIAFDIYEYTITLKEKNRIRTMINKMQQLETKYDFLMIGKLLGKIIFRKGDKEGDKNVTEKEVIDRQKYICSGWVAGVLAATINKFRIYLFMTKKKWTSFTPQDFVHVKGLHLIKRIVFPEEKILDFT